MCTLHFCVDLSAVHLYMSENCVITAFPGYCMVSFPAKNIKPNMILLCKLSIPLRNIFFM